LLLLLATAGGTRAGFVFDVADANIAGDHSVHSAYANLTVTGDTTTGKVIFHLTLAGTNSGKFEDFAFNFKPTRVSEGDFTIHVTGTGGNAAGWQDIMPAPTQGSFGNFSEVVGTTVAADRLTSVDVELDFVAGKFNEARASNFVARNHDGYDFAAHFFPSSGQSGYIGVRAAPAPPALVLLGSGGLCLGAVVAWRRRKPTPG
jgi:hypothetical protein